MKTSNLAVPSQFRALRWIPVIALLATAYGIVPFLGNDYIFEALLEPFLTLSLAALGLNLLSGYTGQLSLGSAAFMAVGAYAAYNFNLRVPGLPLLVSIIFAGLTAAAAGTIFGLPSLRLRGFYLAVSTLAAQFFIQWVLNKFWWFSNYNSGGMIDAPALSLFGISFSGPVGRYLFSLTLVALLTAFTWRLVNTQTGRNFIAVRDNEIAARVVGIPVRRTKLLAFALSSFIIGVAGVLWSFAYLRTIEPDGFNLFLSFRILFIIILGGLATVRGAYFGAALMVVLPLVLSYFGALIFGGIFDIGVLENIQHIFIGALIIIFLIAEPDGLVALWDRVKKSFWRRVGTHTTKEKKHVTFVDSTGGSYGPHEYDGQQRVL
jgi:branched-chain amino acid transport system permease protein